MLLALQEVSTIEVVDPLVERIFEPLPFRLELAFKRKQLVELVDMTVEFVILDDQPNLWLRL
jgi:hypothetical protein